MDEDIAIFLAGDALDCAEKMGASYADVRMYIDDQSERILVKNDVTESVDAQSDSGAGIRVLKNGAWGFASFPDLSQGKAVCRTLMHRAVQDAVELAEASARLRSFPLELAPGPLRSSSYIARYEIPCQIDPFSLPLSHKVDLLRDYCAALGDKEGKIAIRIAMLNASRFTKLFMAMERGSSGRPTIIQAFHSCALELSALGIDGDEVQERSGDVASAAGFEHIARLDGRALAKEFADTSLELLHAPECEPGVYDVIIMPHHLGLHVHETGHGFEGDRLLGYEQTYVGGTFINEILGQMGSYRFGSDAVNIVADATLPGGYGTFAFDDEGVPAQRFFLVQRGIMKNVLTSRETVSQINRRMGRDYFERSNGTMRASSYTRMPLIRMTNISLLPGKETLAGLIGRVDRGLLLDGTQSWSMSEDRKNFDFGVQYAREIRGGKLGRVVRNAGYTGDNLAFWKACEAVAQSSEGYMLNAPNCGKGLPGQIMSTGHLSAPALFRGVQVFNRKQRKSS